MARREGGIHIFPAKLGKEYEDYVKISTYDYVAIEPASVEEVSEEDTGVNDEDPESSITLSALTYSRAETDNAVSRFIRNKKNSFYLPMPDDIKYVDGQSWEAQDVGAMGFYAGEFIKSLTSLDSNNMTATVQAMSEAGMTDFALKMINNITNSNFVTQQSAAKVVNPYREQIFNGMQMRSFEFSYLFVAESQSDQKKLYELISKMREDALPITTPSASILDDLNTNSDSDEEVEDESINNAEALEEFEGRLQDRWFGVPRIFNIEFQRFSGTLPGNKESVRNKALPLLKPCICKGIEIDYTPNNSWATRIDGSPVAISMILTFEEIEIVVAQDVQKGY